MEGNAEGAGKETTEETTRTYTDYYEASDTSHQYNHFNDGLRHRRKDLSMDEKSFDCRIVREGTPPSTLLASTNPGNGSRLSTVELASEVRSNLAGCRSSRKNHAMRRTRSPERVFVHAKTGAPVPPPADWLHCGICLDVFSGAQHSLTSKRPSVHRCCQTRAASCRVATRFAEAARRSRCPKLHVAPRAAVNRAPSYCRPSRCAALLRT